MRRFAVMQEGVRILALAGFYTGARVERVHLTRRELGVAAVGHFGFFRDRFEDTLWREGAAWLLGA